MIIVDTGVLLAVADGDDAQHDACEILLGSYPADQLAVPTPVIVEASWLIEDRLGPAAEVAFLGSFAAGELQRRDLDDPDCVRVVDLVETYADMRLGVVDASVVAVAERLGASRVATLNRRDFTVVRPRHLDAFELLP